MKRLVGAAVPLVLLISGCSNGTTAKASPTVVEITMKDNSFSPSAITVPSKTKIVFRFTNDGSVEHEAIIGSEMVQTEHAKQMSNGGTMSGMGGTESDSATVKPGMSADVTMTFNGPQTVVIGCHEPNHYEAGMKASLTVT